MMHSLSLRAVWLLTLWSLPAGAGTYGPQNFNSLAAGATAAGGGTVMTGAINNTVTAGVVSIQNRPGSTKDRALRLTYLNTFTSLRGNFKLPVLDPGAAITGFEVSFKVMQRAPDLMADGVGMTFGNLAAASNALGSGERGYRAPGSLVVSFDPYTNTRTNLSISTIRKNPAATANSS